MVGWTFAIIFAGAAIYFWYRKQKSDHDAKEEEWQGLKNLVIKMNKDAFAWFAQMYGDSDFAGALIIHNSTQDKWYIRCDTQVCKAIREIIHNHPKISKEFKDEHFSFRLLPLESSGYGSPGDLRRALEEVYTTGKMKY